MFWSWNYLAFLLNKLVLLLDKAGFLWYNVSMQIVFTTLGVIGQLFNPQAKPTQLPYCNRPNEGEHHDREITRSA